MRTSFNTILVPVDFSINTEVAITRALELCENREATVHLLHVAELAPARPLDFYQYFVNYAFGASSSIKENIDQRLQYWQEYIKAQNHGVAAHAWVEYDMAIEKAIIEMINKLNVDLVIIGKNSSHSVMPFLNTVVSSRIAVKSGTSVLTVKPGSLAHHVRTVVVPVGVGFAEEKLDAITALGRKHSIHVRLLLIVENSGESDDLQVLLLRVLRALKARSIENVSYEVVSAGHKGWNILNYCRKVNADMLIVQPGSETRIGWFNKHISDELPARSRTQVLAVGHA